VNPDPDRIVAFAANLRTLCDRQGSVTALCKKIHVNRQQFNKYLSGRHLPTAINLRLIASFFNLDETMLFRAPEDFRKLVDGNFFSMLHDASHLAVLQQFIARMITENSTNAHDFVGVYDKYHYSSIYEGYILKSAFCIYQHHDFLQHYYVERFPSLETRGKIECAFKYHGFSFVLDDKLYTFDFEKRLGNEMTFGVYTRLKRNKKNFMFGMACGVAANTFRQPFSARAALHYKGVGHIDKAHLRQVTVLPGDSPSIPGEVRKYLNEGAAPTREMPPLDPPSWMR